MASENEGKRIYTQLPEGAKKVPDEVQEAINDELKRRSMAVLEKIIDKAASEPEWKQKLLSDPLTAYEEAGLLPEVEELHAGALLQGEVVGQGFTAVSTAGINPAWSATQWYQTCNVIPGGWSYTQYGIHWVHTD